MPHYGENLTRENKNNRMAYILLRSWHDHEGSRKLLSLLGVLEIGSFGEFLESVLLISKSPNLPECESNISNLHDHSRASTGEALPPFPKPFRVIS